jgi:hypothetical protein
MVVIMNLDKLDRILLSDDDVKRILEWDRENHHKFNSIDFPLTEGLLLVKKYADFFQKEITSALYFKISSDVIHFRLYEWDSKEELASFDLDENFYKNQKLSNVKIYFKDSTEDELYMDFKYQFLLLLATFQYMNHHEHVVREQKIRKTISKRPKAKSNSSKNRVVKITSVQYSFDYSNEGAKRAYQRHTESWKVRGHWRHYKNGKSVWIEPYTKGKGEIEPKTYKF